jgi:histidinol-phosphate aminotransferase
MDRVLSQPQIRDFLQRGFSRRQLGRIAAMLAAGSSLPFYNEPAMAQLSAIKGPIPADAVKIDANENPMGPCKEAADAMHAIIPQGGRYQYDKTPVFEETLAEMEGLKPEYVRAFAGSSAPLHQSVLAFTSPEHPFVTADPGYEAGEVAARFIGSKVIRKPVLKDQGYAHDIRGMASASPDTGLIYVCNPNNPTGTTTPRKEIEWLLDNKPKGAIVLLDEAYIHISNERTCSDLVAKDKDVVILRTFSKIYGMAGIRAGAALGRPDLLQKISSYSAGALPITAVAAATASLGAKNVVPERKKIIADVRADVFRFLDKHQFQYIPSVSNKFMVDVHKPGGQVIEAMRAEKIYIGRVWPSWPTHVRVTIGTQDEMNRFKPAFLKVMARS